AYATSKAALVRLTECLADELKSRGIAVNAVAPGMVATEIHEATLSAGPDQAGREHFERTQATVAQGGVSMEVPVACVEFLLSPEADGLTGKTIAAGFDPWRSERLRARRDAIAGPDGHASGRRSEQADGHSGTATAARHEPRRQYPARQRARERRRLGQCLYRAARDLLSAGRRADHDQRPRRPGARQGGRVVPEPH